MNATTPDDLRLLSVDDLEHRLKLSRRQVERLLAQGLIQSVKIGRRRLVHPRDLATFLESLHARPHHP